MSIFKFGSKERMSRASWPSDCYGKNRDTRKPIDGYEVIFSTNFKITSFFSIIERVRKFKESRKGYVIFDKAFDISNRRLPFYYANMTAYIKKEYIDTALKRHNEFMWWIKIN